MPVVRAARAEPKSGQTAEATHPEPDGDDFVPEHEVEGTATQGDHLMMRKARRQSMDKALHDERSGTSPGEG